MSDIAFRTVLRGYEPTDVERHIQGLQAATEQARQEAAQATVDLQKLRAAHAHAEQELGPLRRRVAELENAVENTPPPSFENLGHRIGQILSFAEAEAEDMRRTALDEGQQTVTLAKEQAQRITDHAKSAAEDTVARADAEGARKIAEAQRQADEILDDAAREAAARREEAEAVYEHQRARAAAAAADFEKALSERREQSVADFTRAEAAHKEKLAAAEDRLDYVQSEAERLKAESQREAELTVSNARAEAEQMVRSAKEQAERIRRDSERELHATAEQRAAITAQLSNVRQMLATIGGGSIDLGDLGQEPAPTQEAAQEPTPQTDDSAEDQAEVQAEPPIDGDADVQTEHARDHDVEVEGDGTVTEHTESTETSAAGAKG